MNVVQFITGPVLVIILVSLVNHADMHHLILFQNYNIVPTYVQSHKNITPFVYFFNADTMVNSTKS